MQAACRKERKYASKQCCACAYAHASLQLHDELAGVDWVRTVEVLCQKLEALRFRRAWAGGSVDQTLEIEGLVLFGRCCEVP